MKHSGILIAPLTPVKEDGRINSREVERLLNFLLAAGIDGVCIGGATSEYPRFGLSERFRLIETASGVVKGRAGLLASVGTACYSRTLELGRRAEKDNVDALLLPMPHFYRYRQRDLEHFCRRVGRSLKTPILLYNLPGFTNRLKPETAIRLLRSESSLIGIKDSGADNDSLRTYASARRQGEFTLLVGADELIFDALEAGWDGCISGMGNMCPELLVALVRSYQQGKWEKARECQELILRISDKANKFPVPWAVRAGLEVRGFQCGPGALPVAPTRLEALKKFQAWFERLLDSELEEAIGSAA